MSDKDFVVKNGLVVNTNALVVDGATNKVGVNTASPDATFSVVGTANVTGNVTLTGSTLTVDSNTTFNGNLVVNSNTYFNERIFVGNNQNFVPLYRPVVQAVDKFNGFVQMSSQNLANATSGVENGGTDACSDLVVMADNTFEGFTQFLDIGINNSNFDGSLEYLTVNASADSFALGANLYQTNSDDLITGYGILKARSVNGDDSNLRDLIVSMSRGYDYIEPTDASFNDLSDGVTNSSVSSFSHRNYAFTIGKGNDGYLYVANGALTLGTSEGGRRAYVKQLSAVSFLSATNVITVGNTVADDITMTQDMLVVGTGIPANTLVQTVLSNTSLRLTKSTIAPSSGSYQIYDRYYDVSGNPIIFHTDGMYAENEVGRFVGNGNFVIGPNTTSRADKLNVAGTANITGNVALADNLTVAGNVSISGNVTSNVNFDGGVLFVDSVNNRVGIKNTSPDAALTVTGNANISGNLAIGGNFVVVGSLSYTGTFNSTGDINPLTNNFSLGNTSSLWNLVGNNVAVSNVTVGANVSLNTTRIKVGSSLYYTVVSNALIETTGSLSTKGTSTLVGNVTVGNTAIGDNVSIIVSGTEIKFGNSSVNAVINSTAFNGTSLYATNPSNASSLSSGSVPSARLPSGNATHIGGLQIVDSISNSSATIAASAGSVKNAYDRAIDANTRAASAQTASVAAYANAIAYSGNAALAFANAVANAASYTDTKAATAYSNAVSYADTKSATAFSNAVNYADSLIIDSVTNTYITYSASANSVKNSYDRAIDANTRAASAQTAASSAQTSAIAAYSNSIAYTDIKSVTNLTWTAGSTSGPIINSSTGSGAAIPLASATASGVVSNTTQTIAGVKTFNDATASTTKTTGAVVITGGLGVGGAINAGGDITAYATSDSRLKTNVENIPDALAKVMQLNGVSYYWNDIAEELENKDTSVKEVGVIAQEVNEVLPEVISTRDNGYMAVRYEKIVPLLIEAIKELKAELDTLKSKV